MRNRDFPSSGGIQECSSEEASSPVITSTPQSLRDKNTSFSPVLAFSPHSTSSSGDTGVQVSLGDSIAKVVKLFAMMDAGTWTQFKAFLLFCTYFRFTPTPAALDTICLYVHFLSRTLSPPAILSCYICFQG